MLHICYLVLDFVSFSLFYIMFDTFMIIGHMLCFYKSLLTTITLVPVTNSGKKFQNTFQLEVHYFY